MTKIEPAQSAQPSTATARRVYIETYGCQMNVADSEVVASIMQMDGFHLTEDPELADAIFLNTCSVRDNAELSPETIVGYVKRYARNGSIIVFHDSLKAEKNMRVAMPEAVRWLQSEGYHFLRIGDAP